MKKSSHLFRNLKRYFRGSAQGLSHYPTKVASSRAPSITGGDTNSGSELDLEYVPASIDEDIYGDEAANMPKSNKFDYSKKKNTGVSLGQFIAKQLDGEADAVKRAAERAARKSISSVDGPDSDTSVTHHIDLKVPGKELGDNGLSVLCDGLEAALGKGTADASLALEDVDLTANDLTTTGLARFAPVIRNAKFDIKSIVLAHNAITVESDQQAGEWETFLRSFADCQKLRRLDLSGNPGLGRRAMEVLAMVHVREPQVDPIRAIGESDVQSLHSTTGDDSRTRSGSLSLEVNGDTGRLRHTISDGRTLTRRRGLRSIPFISLKACSLSDAGALWLSYVIEDHYYPVQLVSELNAAMADCSIEAYRQDSKAHGIDWLGNDATLTKDGLSLLIKTESVRKQTVLDDRSTLPGSIPVETSPVSVSQGNGVPAERRLPRAAPGSRRVSLKSTVSAGDDEQGLTELDSWRKRIQRQMIAHDEAKSADLWHAALRLLRVSRCLRMAAPTTCVIYTGPKLFICSTDKVKPLTIRILSPVAPIKTSMGGQAVQLSIDPAKAQRNSYAGTLGSPEVALTDVTNTPTTPKRVFKAHRKDAFSHGADSDTVTEKLSGLAIRIASGAEYLHYQEDRMNKQGGTAFRDMSSVCHLPQELLGRILGLAVGEREMALFSELQMKAVVGWGMRRETLTTGLQGKDLSFRAWMLLDKIKCIEYAAE
ncbi:hypothetical protein LTR78_004240 [Recurvomyces mirabilis]|uniref:Uncharacterized protein n=1 Tax=Recurvomyces mirabilis TaxID=574656 RepID=A0AAE1C2V5_9PEZI|nr:hypothetical protein LTR78_004240 [Recurvomyces mirabilis]KAK5153590.1 hypothetical protein LTS14_007284 [Recurvomyces mirabilis]